MLPSALLLLLPLPFASASPFAIPPPDSSPLQPTGLGGRSVSLAHTPISILRSRHLTRSLDPTPFQPQERDALLSPLWLLKEESKIDTRYNQGQGNFSVLLASSGSRSRTKRAGEVDVTNHNLDSSYSGVVTIGTPGQNFDVILDTGSSDLWVAAASSAATTAKYQPSASRTFVNLNSSFSIQYGSGAAAGTLCQDTVTLGGYSVASQVFAQCTDVDSGLIAQSVSGIMGLGWPALAYSKATPWWVTLAKSSAWQQPLFAFYLKRWRNIAGASSIEPDGGEVTFGYTDSSMYSGSITWVSVNDNSQYWEIPMDSMVMQGKTINLGSSTMVAVDTGTTLIGGPSDIIQSIYASIPGSQRMSGAYANYYQYPCSTNINFKITFGGYTINIADADFNLGRYSDNQNMCTGAAYIQSLSDASPVQWIVGDTALKNVYSVYRYSPAAVGFAALPGAGAGGGGGAASSSISTTIPAVPSAALPTGSTRNISLSSSTSSSRSGSISGSATGTTSSSVSIAAPSVVVVTAVSTVVASGGGGPSGAAASPSTSRQSAAAPRLGPTASVSSLGAWVGVLVLLMGASIL